MTRRGRRALSNAVDEIVQDAEDEIAGDDPLGEVWVSWLDPEDERPENGLIIDFNATDT